RNWLSRSATAIDENARMVVVAKGCWRSTTPIMQHRLRLGLSGLVRFLCDGPLADLDFVLERFDCAPDATRSDPDDERARKGDSSHDAFETAARGHPHVIGGARVGDNFSIENRDRQRHRVVADWQRPAKPPH